MVKFNEEKLAKLRTFEDHLREKYGEPGSVRLARSLMQEPRHGIMPSY